MSQLLSKVQDALNQAESDLKNASKELEEIWKYINLMDLLPEEGRDEILETLDERIGLLSVWEVPSSLSLFKKDLIETVQKRIVIKQEKEG